MAIPVLKHSPIDPRAFLEEVFRSDEYKRRYIPNTSRRYARGRHGGYDMQRRGKPDTLYAVADGVVKRDSFGSPFGIQMTLVLRDGSGWFYAHCQEALRDGTRVKAGDKIGRMGTSGGVAEHLHFEWRRRWRDWTTDEDPGAQLRALQQQMRQEDDMDKAEVEAIVKNMLNRPDLLRVLTQAMETTGINGSRIIRAVESVEDHIANHPEASDPEGGSGVRHSHKAAVTSQVTLD